MAELQYMLDTDVFSALARAHDQRLLARAQAAGLDAMSVSVVTEGKVRYGQALQPVSPAVGRRIDDLLLRLRRLPLDSTVVAPYAELCSRLQRLGRPIGPNDIWIGAHALATGLVLVTGNIREFARVPGLRVENWMR